MDNQRKESRKKLMAFAPVYDLLHKALLGYVGDLTPQGVMVVGEKSFEINKRFMLGMEFPDAESETRTMKIIISARVAWCRQEKTPQNFNTGFEFIDTSLENAKIIDAIMIRYQFRRVQGASDLES